MIGVCRDRLLFDIMLFSPDPELFSYCTIGITLFLVTLPIGIWSCNCGTLCRLNLPEINDRAIIPIT